MVLVILLKFSGVSMSVTEFLAEKSAGQTQHTPVLLTLTQGLD